MKPGEHDDQPRAAGQRYQITVRGRLGPRWAPSFEGLDLTTGDGQTVIEGHIPDQAALHRVLRVIRDLGLELESVTRLDAG